MDFKYLFKGGSTELEGGVLGINNVLALITILVTLFSAQVMQSGFPPEVAIAASRVYLDKYLDEKYKPIADAITFKETEQINQDINNQRFIWDGSNEDNDIITIFYDNQPILENFVIKNKKTLIELPFSEVESAKLKFSAISTGSEGKNTVNIIFIDDNVITPFVSVLDKNESIVININKK